MTGRQPSATARSALLRHGVVILVSRALWALSVMLTVPFVLNRLGTSGFGVWESVVAVGAMAAVFQTVLGGTTLWKISTLHGEDNLPEMLRIARVGIGLALGMSAVLTVLVWPFTETLSEWLRIPLEHRTTVHWLFPWAVLFNLLNGVNQVLLALLAGRQVAGTAALVQNAGLIFANGLTVLVIILGMDLSALAWGLASTFGLTFCMAYRSVLRCCPGFRPWPKLPHARDLQTVGPYAGLIFLSALTVLFRDQLDKLLLSAQVSTDSTAHFVIAQRVTSLIMQICIVLHVPLTAGVAVAFSQGDWGRVGQLYATAAHWICLLCGWLTLIVCALRSPLFVAWIGHDPHEAHAFLWPLLLGTSSAIMLSGAAVAVTKGVGKPGLETVYTLITLGLTLVSKPILITLFGTWGAVLSSALSWSLGAWFLHLWIHRLLPLPLATAWNTQGMLLSAIVMSSLGWWWGSQVSPPASRLEAIRTLLVQGTTISLVYGLLMGVLFFRRPIYARWIRLAGLAERLSRRFEKARS